eukprot:Skav210772  [mRNA]  locus=scaffold3765:47814:54705:+ [translate_table: standard]
MFPLRPLLATLLLLCDPLTRVSRSWGVGDLGIPNLFAGNDTCPAGGSCEKGEPEQGGVRGVPPRPDATPKTNWWPWSFEWLIKISLKMISDAATTSLHYCGTLCASIGLAARWSYWLAVAMVALFLVQLLVWTCNWVLIPLGRHSLAFWRYLRGDGHWYELAQIHGVRVFRPKWIGPQGREDWSAGYVQTEVRGRGDGREPFDLLVTDGTAIARLRHGTLRGRTNRFGFRADCDSVHASSHRYFRNQLEGMECRVHLCSQRPCGQPDDDCLHVVASAVIPRQVDFDLQDAAGKGPFARCATAAWLCGYSTMGMCGTFWKSVKRGIACVFCSGCLCKRRAKPRNRAAPSSGHSTPRHENSETESEAEDEVCCQAESVAYLVGNKATPLALVPCKDAARGTKVKLLASDAEVSSSEDLKHDDGCFYFASCNHHRALYEGQAAKRTCVYEGCDREVKVPKGGLRLCKLHGAKEEKVKPSSKLRGTTSGSKELPIPVTSSPEPEARIAPGPGERSEPTTPGNASNPQATTLGKYLRLIMDGKDEFEALKECANPGCGPRETWEDLKDQATLYVTKLPRDYPAKARKAIVFLVTEDCHVSEWKSEPVRDPVLDLGLYAPQPESSGERGLAHKPVEVLPQPVMSAQREERQVLPTVNSLYRPKGSVSLPEGMGMGSSIPQHPSGYDAFAAASRPRHTGAYTDGEPPRMDETTKALQAIAKAVTSKDEAASHDKGKLAAIGKIEERLVYLVRGCDALTVSLGKATVGKELFHALRSTSTQGRPQLRLMQFPVNINNRIAYGLAAMSLGGKDAKTVPDYSLSAADFPLTSEEEFDGWTGCVDLKLEKRPKPPMTLNAWYRNALREAWAISCVYGSEHYSTFEQAATYLLKLGEEHAYMWPAHAIFGVWEELWARYVEELKDLDRELRRAMKEETPTFERIRFFVTAPGEDGEPWLRLPRTFFLDDGKEYFQTDVIPRHNRMLSRACWQVALKKGPGGGLHGGKAGEDPEASLSRPGPKLGKVEPTAKGLLGPPLTNKEAARALDHRPKEKKGARYLCWDHLCHRGCAKPSSCPHSHGTAPKWEHLDWAVQLQMLRRGGLRSQARLNEQQVTEQMETIRKAQQTKTHEMVNEGKKVKKVGESIPGDDDAKVGEFAPQTNPQAAPPEEFTSIHPTDQEEEMMNLLEGPDNSFFEDHDRNKPAREAQFVIDETQPDMAERKELMSQVEEAQFTEGFGEQLKCFIHNQLLMRKEETPDVALGLEDVRKALEHARAHGCPALSAAADEALQGANMSRAGYSPNVGSLTSFTWEHEVGHGTLSWSGGSWDVWDYGDKLHPTGAWPQELIPPQLDESGPESRQCLLLHCSAGYLYGKLGRVPTWAEVQKHTNELRAEMVGQASEASRHLGECPEQLPRSEADLRVFVHDLLHWSHDKDYRTLASFPSSNLLDKTLYVVRMASDCDLSTEVIMGALSSGHRSQQIHLLVHQGHMRLLIPKALDRSPPVIREVIAAGWECHLEAANGSEASVRARDYLLCPRCNHSEEVPRRSGSRPPSVLGLHLRSDAGEKIGQWTPGHLETKDLYEDKWTDDELADWLGPQAEVFRKALQHGLDFLEVYAGKARASHAVLERGDFVLATYGGPSLALRFVRGSDWPSSAIVTCTNELRAEMVGQASEASRHLGECPEQLPRSEADLRVFVHDLLHWSHDKDYRTLASFPSSNLLDKTLYVVRMASDCDLSTEVIMGALSSGHRSQQIHLLVHQGHMRLLIPKALDRSPPVIREVIAAGWECHLEAANGSEASVRARDYLLCPRCNHSEEVPRRSGSRPPSVLGLHLRSDAGEKIGQWTPGHLETKDLYEDKWTDDELADWLGPQAGGFRKALQHGLDFLEVYAGKARASHAVLERGGLALYLGLDHGQDFRRAKDRSLGRALVRRLRPRHLWGAFPCTPFCAWIRLAILRNCDMTLRLKEGRVHLKFITELCTLQVDDGRDAHLENPLTSLAWKEPLALAILSHPRWLRARLDQCQTGLSSPAGGLHLKPTLIRTTDASMQQALSLSCPRDHPHDPVEGSATALSAMYSPHMAALIAQVVCPSPPRSATIAGGEWDGGEGAFLFHRPTARVGGTEASFSPGQTPYQWFEGLKGPTLRGPLVEPLKEAVEKACKEYLGFVSTEPYSKEAFKRGAELGSQVLREAGGWEEANRGVRKTWVTMKGDHFDGLHSDFFDGLVAPELLAKARENAIWGISARYEGGVGDRVQCGPHPSLKEHLEEAAQQRKPRQSSPML